MTKPPSIQRLVSGFQNRGMLRQPQIIIGAQAQHWLAIADADVSILRRGNDPLPFVSPGRADFLQLCWKIFLN